MTGHKNNQSVTEICRFAAKCYVHGCFSRLYISHHQTTTYPMTFPYRITHQIQNFVSYLIQGANYSGWPPIPIQVFRIPVPIKGFDIRPSCRQPRLVVFLNDCISSIHVNTQTGMQSAKHNIKLFIRNWKDCSEAQYKSDNIFLSR